MNVNHYVMFASQVNAQFVKDALAENLFLHVITVIITNPTFRRTNLVTIMVHQCLGIVFMITEMEMDVNNVGQRMIKKN